ncbi:hypothetical protein [Microbulbifer magnicolonia]|uniref:hypothetical protein n=1 Tax=Microbulbifer magnicolonia TaxID=3109744 RepID=UPI002B40EB2E|nr:hypothetical protein [Microbulbifer sp. GG15]
MRLLMQVLIPVEKGNASYADKSMSAAISEFIEAAKPEAAYFHVWQGKRAAVFIFEETQQDKLMAHNEALFAALNAEIWITPTLSLAELQKHL